jgi:TctA family transporter
MRVGLLLLPAVFHLPAEGALMMLAGIYYGAQYGSSTTAILLRVPGEASGVVTMLDGHALARQGRAGPALGIAALASLVGGVVAALILAVLLRPVAALAVGFSPAEMAALVLLGAAAAVAIAPGPLLPAWGLLVAGALLGLVGTDAGGGRPRLTLGIPELADGIGFAPLAVGLFGIAELIRALSRPEPGPASAIGRVWPNRAELRESAGPALRGSAAGSAVGIVPGGSTLLAALAAYALERGLFGRGRRFGQGELAGVAAPEAANNAAAQTAFAPLLALGLPTSAVMAVLAGAMLMVGVAPGPAAVAANPDLIWGLVGSMLVGNALLLAINLPMIGLWVALLRVPMRVLAPPVLLACCVGVWSGAGSLFDIWLMLGFGLLGWLLMRNGLDPTPLLLGFVLGPVFEEAMRRTLVLSRNDWTVFATEPASAALLLAALMVTWLGTRRRARSGMVANGSQ